MVKLNENGDSCPICGGELSFCYGFGGGSGLGSYEFCLDCDRVISKHTTDSGECFNKLSSNE